jgi:hypothetical protein
MVASLLGAAAFFFPRASSAPTTIPKKGIIPKKMEMTTVSELAAPLLQREFTSSCLSDGNGFYRETLRFAANATTTFARHYYADAKCLESIQQESVQEGRFAVAEEEAGQLLLIVRNLHDAKTANVTPYFEALIKVDREQLVMQSDLSKTLHYTASTKAI